MKKVLLGVLLIALVGVGIYSCTKQQTQEENTKTTIEKKIEGLTNRSLSSGDPIFLPPGTTIDSSTNPLTFSAPSGWKYVYELNNDNTARVGNNTGSVTCNCTAGGSGCHPYVHSAGFFECRITSPCTACTKTESVGSVLYKLSDLKKGGFINFNSPPRAMYLNEALPGAFSTMFQVQEVKAVIDSIEYELYGNGTVPNPIANNDNGYDAPANHTFVYMNIFGRGLAMIVPNNQLSKISGANAVSTTSVKCSCQVSGKTGCVKEILEGPYRGCDAGDCPSCRLDNSSSLVNIRHYNY